MGKSLDRWWKKKSVYVTYFVKNNKHAKFIIGEGKRLSVLGQKRDKSSRV